MRIGEAGNLVTLKDKRFGRRSGPQEVAPNESQRYPRPPTSLPERFGPWTTPGSRFRRWTAVGIWAACSRRDQRLTTVRHAPFDRAAYREQPVGRLVNRLKQHRRVATRYQMRAGHYAACCYWPRCYSGLAPSLRGREAGPLRTAPQPARRSVSNCSKSLRISGGGARQRVRYVSTTGSQSSHTLTREQ